MYKKVYSIHNKSTLCKKRDIRMSERQRVDIIDPVRYAAEVSWTKQEVLPRI